MCQISVPVILAMPAFDIIFDVSELQKHSAYVRHNSYVGDGIVSLLLLKNSLMNPLDMHVLPDPICPYILMISPFVAYCDSMRPIFSVSSAPSKYTSIVNVSFSLASSFCFTFYLMGFSSI